MLLSCVIKLYERTVCCAVVFLSYTRERCVARLRFYVIRENGVLRGCIFKLYERTVCCAVVFLSYTRERCVARLCY